MIFSRVYNHNGHVVVLVEDLLDAAVVGTLSGVLLTGSAIVGFLGIAEIIGLGYEVRGIYIRVAA